MLYKVKGFIFVELHYQLTLSHIHARTHTKINRIEPGIDTFPPIQTTEIYHRDRTLARKVTWLEVIDFNFSNVEVASVFIILIWNKSWCDVWQYINKTKWKQYVISFRKDSKITYILKWHYASLRINHMWKFEISDSKITYMILNTYIEICIFVHV